MRKLLAVALLFAAQAFAGSTVTVLPPGDLARTGHTFVGWGTAPTGGTVYAPGATFEIANANVTLYAQWAPIAPTPGFRVTYDANGATSGVVPIDPNEYTPAAAPPPVTGCAPGEVFGPNDIVNPMTVGYIFPTPAAGISGPLGVAVSFTADAAAFPTGLQMQVFDEGGNPAKEAVVSACPHNFTPVNGNALCRRGAVTAKADFYLTFGPPQTGVDCPLQPGQKYYLNVRAADLGTTATRFYNFTR